ncbi:MAG: MDR family MFS transporter [Ilumatobacteraceae bacterium]
MATDDRVRVLGRVVEYKWIVAVFSSALFLDILDTSIVNVALPKLATDFRTEAVEWVVLGYTLSLAVWIPVSGWLGDRLGTKRIFLIALVLFIGGSALCGAAQSIGQLIAFRIFQGVGGGMLTPVGTAMLFRAFPPAERARAAMFLMIPTLAAPASGPVIGGLIVTHIGWRWIFLVNLPVGIVVFAFGILFLREHREPTAGRLDVPGLRSRAGLALIDLRVERSAELWLDVEGGPRYRIGGFRRLRRARVVGAADAGPDARPSPARRSPVPRLQPGGAFSTASFLGPVFVIPLYLQTLRGYGALHSGLTTFPQAFGIMFASQIAGRLYPRIGPRRLMAGGLAWAALLIASFATFDLTTSLWTIRILIFVRGLGMGFAFVPMQAASYARIAPKDNGRASSIYSTQRQMAVSLGVAALSTVLASYMPLGRPTADVERALTGYHVAFLVAAAFAFVGAAWSWFFVKDVDAADTMVVRRARTGVAH